MDGDGRLELDDLGTVIQRASSLDAPPSEDVLAGNDSRTWGERLESVGVTPWLRRHRVVLAVGCVTVLAAGGLVTGWQRSQPPPLDTTPAATVEDAAIPQFNGSGVFQIEPDTLLAAYVITHQRSGTTSTVLGIAGPGIRVSSTRGAAEGEAPLQDGALEVQAIIGCDDPDAMVPGPDGYRVLLSQTDAYGRSTQVQVPVPATTSTQWAQNVQQICLQRLLPSAVTATSQTVHTDLAHRTVTVDLAMRNTSTHSVTIGTGGGNGQAQYVPSSLVSLAAGATGAISYSQRVIDCSIGHFDGASLPAPDGRSSREIDGANFYASLDEATTSFSATLTVPWTPAVAAATRSAYRRVCTGVPVTTARVVSASQSPVDPNLEFATGGDASLVALRMTIDVATTADRVDLGDTTPPEDLLNGATATITSSDALVSGGHAQVTVDWLVGCGGVTSPPIVALTVRTGTRTWPLHATVNQRALTAAYVAACPLLLPSELTDNGWEPLRLAP